MHSSHPSGPPAGERRSPYNQRLALGLFAVYVLLYVGFMAITAASPQMMERIVLGGVNLAIAYGMGLIFMAIILAVLYMALCRTEQPDVRQEEGK